MNADLISQVRDTRERARLACQRAEECKQRAVRLVVEASVLMQRFDELERRVLLRTTMAQRRHRPIFLCRH